MKFKNIEGLKAISIALIVLVHVAVNGSYHIDNYVYNVIVKHLSIFIELFFMLSAFGMCCGYYEKFKNGEIDLNTFYKRRILRILPYFLIVVVIDLVMSGFTKKNIIEAFLDGTLSIGLLPNNHIEIAGVGWTIGVIFAFYMLFPFFVFIMWNKIRAWISLAISLIIVIFGTSYLGWKGHVERGNILTWLFMFILGGLIFLYKDDLIRIFKNKAFLLIILFVALFGVENLLYIKGYHLIASKVVILSFITIVIYAISGKEYILGNKVMTFLGGLCLQIYLFHMMVFRIIEKIKIVHIFNNEIVSLIVCFVITLAVTIAVSYVIRKVIDTIIEKATNKSK